MADETKTAEATPEPRGLGEHARGLAGEYAHEQGWGLNEAERTAVPAERQPTYGGTDYDYGARDFGDEATDMTGSEGMTAEGLEKDVEKALGGSTQGGGATTEQTKQAGDERATDSKNDSNVKE